MNTFNLKRFLVSRFSGALGDQFLMFAVPLIILKNTGSVKWSALAFAIEWLPRLLFLPVSGSLADRVNVKKLYKIADLSRTLLVLVSFGLLLIMPSKTFWVLSLAMAGMSVLNSLAFIGMEATLPRQLPPDEMPKAQALLQGMDQISQVLGPALAAAMVAFLPMHFVLLSGALFFGVSFFNSLSLPDSHPGVHAKVSFCGAAVESYQTGFRTLFEKKILLQICALTWIVNLVYGTALVVGPAIVTQSFARSQSEFGLLQTFSALICVFCFMLAPRLVTRFKLHGLGLMAFVILCVSGFMGAEASGMVGFSISFGLLMGSDGLFNVFIRSLRARVIPKKDFGKVTGVIILVNNFSLPISGVVVSALASSMTPQNILFLMTGVASLLGLTTVLIGRNVLRYKTVMPSLTGKQAELCLNQ